MFGAAAVIALLVPSWASAQSDVAVSLAASRVSLDADGKESLAAAEKANPGDLIEYRAVYRNPATAPVRQLAATLPIPPGTEFIPGTAQPRGALASLDGRTFEAMPIKRTVRLDDGREVVREVPLSEYRYLRWSIGELAAGAERTVRARVRVSPLPEMANNLTR
jgi:uncharacterized repeat protein (TIGR01451 family)